MHLLPRSLVNRLPWINVNALTHTHAQKQMKLRHTVRELRVWISATRSDSKLNPAWQRPRGEWEDQCQETKKKVSDGDGEERKGIKSWEGKKKGGGGINWVKERKILINAPGKKRGLPKWSRGLKMWACLCVLNWRHPLQHCRQQVMPLALSFFFGLTFPPWTSLFFFPLLPLSLFSLSLSFNPFFLSAFKTPLLILFTCIPLSTAALQSLPFSAYTVCVMSISSPFSLIINHNWTTVTRHGRPVKPWIFSHAELVCLGR